MDCWIRPSGLDLRSRARDEWASSSLFSEGQGQKKEKVMKTDTWQAAGFLMVLLAAAATAQNNPAILKADIPFPFVVANHTLPAGHYVVGTLGEQTIRIANAHQQGAFVLTSRVDGRASKSLGKLVFYRYEDRYFLTQVWNAGNNHGKQVFKSAAEEELERKGASKEIAVLRAEK
jgi:hypothetical protein